MYKCPHCSYEGWLTQHWGCEYGEKNFKKPILSNKEFKEGIDKAQDEITKKTLKAMFESKVKCERY